MRIGVWLGTYSNPQEGGGFSYVDRLIKAIDAYQFDPLVDVCFISEGEYTRNLKRDVIKLHYCSESLLHSLLIKIIFIKRINSYVKCYIQNKINKKREYEYTKQLVENHVKLIYYLQQAQCVLPDFPFISTNWDIGHCSTYAFPEIASVDEFRGRAAFYQNILPRALFVFSESVAGRNELIKYTSINSQKIKVVHIFAGECVKHQMNQDEQKRFLDANQLKKNFFFFYPAQFWAHKNHVGLLNAFRAFLKKYPNYKLVFTGSDKGTLAHVREKVFSYGIQESVLFLGFVTTEEINTLYQNATSLIMASYFGTTNMPLLEAIELGCPVICTDLEGHREELGEAGLYFNPTDPNDIMQKMVKMVEEREDILNLIREQAKKNSFTIENALKEIDDHLCEASIIRDNWDY